MKFKKNTVNDLKISSKSQELESGEGDAFILKKSYAKMSKCGKNYMNIHKRWVFLYQIK